MDRTDRIAGQGTAAAEQLALPRGSELFGADRAPGGLYWLRSGHIRLSGADAVILDHLNPGAVFGEKALLGHPAPKRQTAVAVSAVKVSVFRRARLTGQMRDDPHFAMRTIKALGRRLDRYEQVIGDFVREPADRRLALMLLRIAPSRPGWIQIPFPLSNPELSNMVGTSRWRISQLLSRFQSLGMIRRRPGLWIQREALRKYLK